jgi:hypothetical protein
MRFPVNLTSQKQCPVCKKRWSVGADIEQLWQEFGITKNRAVPGQGLAQAASSATASSLCPHLPVMM